MSVSHSIIVVGAGITGLCLGLRALDLGLGVTLISKDEVADTVSALAAGMIAPALEALSEPDPKASFAHYRAAQSHWLTLASDVGLNGLIAMARPAAFVFRPLTDQGADLDVYLTRLKDMGARARALDEAQLAALGLGDDFAGFEVERDWLMEARGVLNYLMDLFITRGGRFMKAEVVKLMRDGVILSDGETVTVGHVALAGGWGSKRFATDVPGLHSLTPIKGHILNIEREPPEGMAGRTVRSPFGYGVYYGGFAKFGATMQPGQSDDDIEPAVVDALFADAQKLAPKDFSFAKTDIEPEAGVRASSPDGLPVIGLDAKSGVWLATGMRRNGWLFAPFAADLLLRQIAQGLDQPDGAPYDPARFAKT
jgi:glycine/D-amino acid oxidase-like deaminating enzyme